MKRALLLSGLLAVLPVSSVAAQITFEASDLAPFIGHRTQSRVYLMNASSYPALTSILNATGSGQTYDFTPFSYGFPTAVAYDVLSSAAGTPGANDPDFGGANWVQQLGAGGNFYAYYSLQDDGFFLLGSIFAQATDTDGNGVLDQSVQKNAPADPTYRLPMTDGSAWHEEFVSTTMGFFGSTSEVTSTVDFLVEGWGTLVTPAGSASALRLRKTLTVQGSGTPGYTTTSYIFITKQQLGASIVLDAQGQVLGASYNDNGMGPTEVEDTPLLAFQLDQNYPNPFSHSTNIAFELERPGHVTLSVFDVIGREVSRLVDTQLPSGSYVANFLAEDLPSGVYFYRLQMDGSTSTRQIILRR